MTRRRIGISALLIVVVALVAVMLLRGGLYRPVGPRIGILRYADHPVLNTVVENFLAEMSILGYKDGETATFLQANAEGISADIAPLTRGLLRKNLAVYVPVSTPVSRVAFESAPMDQVVVYSFVTNPDDLEPELSAHHGTGVSDRINYQKSLQLVRELFPEARKLGLLYNPTERNSEVALAELRAIAPSLGFELKVESIAAPTEIRDAARRLTRGVDVMFIGPDNTVVGNASTVTHAAAEAQKPVIAVDSGSVEAGALAAYSVDYADVGRETARLVDRILKNPGSVTERVLPIYNDTLVINFCAAEKIGFKFPESVLGKAARVVRCPPKGK